MPDRGQSSNKRSIGDRRKKEGRVACGAGQRRGDPPIIGRAETERDDSGRGAGGRARSSIPPAVESTLEVTPPQLFFKKIRGIF
ncbi:MAG: hypothetical protein A2659_03640 [Candidatus Yanofskybacteria bacterium RIFCSPHIGHO2_01_FULL_44_24]|nr:MAG: hypothetical protein A2659_03640 [Candidatus Yanofskybacteria bacterium RIFCSPHIGHO2_01_FULL_44_24]